MLPSSTMSMTSPAKLIESVDLPEPGSQQAAVDCRKESAPEGRTP